MLNSDAPKSIADNVFIPQGQNRKIDHSEEAHDEGGGFSFVFHDGKEQNNKKADEGKKKDTDIGDPVEVKLSGKNETKEKHENGYSPETVRKHEDENDHPGGKINITV
jgi:hypothetical protein